MQAKVSGKHFKVNSACILSDLALLGNARAVVYPGCTLSSCPVTAAGGAFIVTEIRNGSTCVRLPCLR